MKVRMLTGLSGSNGSFAPGDEYECSPEEGARLIKRELAEAIKAPAKKETATRKSSKKETAKR